MNEQIVYGSHNTMTYLPIKNWWLFPGLLTARCQNNNIGEQFKNGARVFDLRPYFNDKTKRWEFAHGLIKFKSKSNKFLPEVVWVEQSDCSIICLYDGIGRHEGLKLPWLL